MTPPKKQTHSVVHHPSKVPEKKPIDVTWIEHYKKLETAHGDYTIPADKKIKVKNGKVEVPVEVEHHYEDLIKADEHR